MENLFIGLKNATKSISLAVELKGWSHLVTDLTLKIRRSDNVGFQFPTPCKNPY